MICTSYGTSRTVNFWNLVHFPIYHLGSSAVVMRVARIQNGGLSSENVNHPTVNLDFFFLSDELFG